MDNAEGHAGDWSLMPVASSTQSRTEQAAYFGARLLRVSADTLDARSNRLPPTPPVVSTLMRTVFSPSASASAAVSVSLLSGSARDRVDLNVEFSRGDS